MLWPVHSWHTPDQLTCLSPAQGIFGKKIRDFIACTPGNYLPRPEWRLTAEQGEQAHAKRHIRTEEVMSRETLQVGAPYFKLEASKQGRKAAGLEQFCDLSASMNIFMIISMNKVINLSTQALQINKLIDLDKSVLLSSDLAKWTQNVLICYKNQLKMNQIVAKNIRHLKSREEALFHSNIWVAQPGHDTKCLVAKCAMEQILKSCSD